MTRRDQASTGCCVNRKSESPRIIFHVALRMARSSFLPVLLVAALFVVPAFVPSPAPRVSPHAAAAAGAVPLLLVAQPALAEAG